MSGYDLNINENSFMTEKTRDDDDEDDDYELRVPVMNSSSM